MAEIKKGVQTIYVMPAATDRTPFCNVYAMPYPMRPEQEPRDIALAYRHTWVHIAQRNGRGELSFLDPDYASFRQEIADLGPGEWMEVHL